MRLPLLDIVVQLVSVGETKDRDRPVTFRECVTAIMLRALGISMTLSGFPRTMRDPSPWMLGVNPTPAKLLWKVRVLSVGKKDFFTKRDNDDDDDK